MKIVIETIPHNEQRYETVGDWFRDAEGVLHIKVSEMSNPHHEFLVAMHELAEVWLCEQRDITDQEVTRFDEMFEMERAHGEHSEDSEAGDDPRAPYRDEHFFATNIERMLAYELGVDWEEYNAEIMAL